ncbi:hypothetical protein [Bradyrhizobium sp. Arg816]|uniref:hypothetical protein n=1 Tax=Bradyrhizobium sp. Arg816 TaxID=2998491 RepID=UPI00249F30FD|nr:hypothetical protein [Bradyrhizobium sp. Arg816]MDI3566286.1 hypothetical protein [Bradyrhizobium sp. Arg816]
MQIKLPETDLTSVQSLGSFELKDEGGRHVGQYFFGKGYGRTVFLFGKYKGTFKTHAECQAFIDGVTAVIDDNRGSRSEATS